MGVLVSKWLQLVQMLAPTILTTIKPSLAPIASNITSGIQIAEDLKNAGTITDKLAHVQGIALQAAGVVNTAAGKNVIDTSSLNAAVQEGVDTTVAVVNLIHKKPTVVN
jgi:hypothetical protein